MPPQNELDEPRMLNRLFKAHPWHGVPAGAEAPTVVNCFIEIVPTDTVKYELDKETGHLRVDRPQRFSNVCPTLYGFVPQTYCGARTAELCRERTGRANVSGDNDPLDICVLTENAFAHGEVILAAIPIGGFRMIDEDEADDKIIAVLKSDATYGAWRDIGDCPESVVNRLKHYFLTYKDVPGDARMHCEIAAIYDAAEAHDVIRRTQDDYAAEFSDLVETTARIFPRS